MGLFDLLKPAAKSAEPPPPAIGLGPRIAMVALSENAVPDPDHLQLILRTSWPQCPSMRVKPSSPTVFDLILGERTTATVGLVPHPIQPEELQPALEFAWHWPEAVDVMQYHAAHLIVGIETDEPDMIVNAMLLTRLCAALAQAGECPGVLWPCGAVVNTKDMFVQSAAQMTPDQLPLILWLSFRIETPQENLVSISTFGMRGLEFLDVELINFPMGRDAAVNLVYQIAHHMLVNGVIPATGEQVNGLTATRTQSAYDKDLEVVRFEVPTA